MKEIKLRVECNYPDTVIGKHTIVDNTEVIEVNDFNDLYKVLKEKKEENILDHVHLRFEYLDDGIYYSLGSVTIPFNDKVSVSIRF